MLSSNETFLSLVRLGIGNTKTVIIPDSVDWRSLEALAARQGLSAILVDGVEKLPDDKRPPKPILLQWIGETLQGYEYRYELYRNTLSEMAGWYESHGFKMMVLKGYACCLNWPKPMHRPCGDIDIWQFGQQKEADAALTKEKGIEIDNSHHHHTVFEWGDFIVENHYDFINIHRHKSHKGLETIFRELGVDESYSVELNGEKVYLPSPNLHALFLLRHALNHFASIGINLRQVLDWAFFVKRYTKEIDWQWLHSVLDEYSMKDFYSCLNAICVEDLGFDACLFPSVQFLPSLKDRVVDDIISQGLTINEPLHLFPELLHKYRRWRNNAWKQELCYNESRWDSFWSGLWSIILKPDAL